MSKRIEALYDVTFRVPSTKLGTLMDTMKGFAYLVGVVQHTPPGVIEGLNVPSEIRGTITPLKQLQTSRQFRYAGGKANKGIAGIDLLRELVKDGQPHTIDDIGTEFVKRSFARSSALNYVNQAHREGWLTKVDRQTVILTSALNAQGALKG